MIGVDAPDPAEYCNHVWASRQQRARMVAPFDDNTDRPICFYSWPCRSDHGASKGMVFVLKPLDLFQSTVGDFEDERSVTFLPVHSEPAVPAFPVVDVTMVAPIAVAGERRLADSVDLPAYKPVVEDDSRHELTGFDAHKIVLTASIATRATIAEA